jgi:hypothetical protein
MFLAAPRGAGLATRMRDLPASFEIEGKDFLMAKPMPRVAPMSGR